MPCLIVFANVTILLKEAVPLVVSDVCGKDLIPPGEVARPLIFFSKGRDACDNFAFHIIIVS